MLAQRTGAILTFLPVQGDNGLLDLTRLDELLTPEVKIFAFTHISNTMGTINPAAELCARARALGVTTLVDAAQSAGHCRVDVQEIGCDFLAFSGHKILGPTGIGVLYGREEKFAETPPYQGGGEMIATVDWQTSKYKSAPHGFEAGTPDVAGAVGLHAAMDYLDAIGRDAIFAHDQALAAYAYTRLSELGGIRLFGQFPVGRCPRARRGDGRRPAWHRVARRAPLQPAAAPQTRRQIHRAREFLFLQQPGGSGPARRGDGKDPGVF
jgi:cysteine desulfurase/selenocysteine lyase